jgi:hypothetical protein
MCYYSGMIQDRIVVAERQFEEQKAKREEHLRLAEECLVEMNKLQGEYRVLTDLLKEEPNKQATVIEAVPEKEKK